MERKEFELIETGDWAETSQFCRNLSGILQDELSAETYERFETWRPRTEDSGRALRQKTAEDESIQETQIEKKSEGAAEELSAASQEMKQGGKDMVRGRPKDTIKDVGEAGNSAAKGFLPPVIRMIRRIEEVLYTNIIGKTSPQYFESKEITVAIEHNFFNRSHYKVRVMCEDASLMDEIEHTLQEQAANSDTADVETAENV